MLAGSLLLLFLGLLAPKCSANLILNPSMEAQAGTKPDHWDFGSWGTLTSTFTYALSDGFNSAHSVKVEVKSYESGDAKWYFNPVPSVGQEKYTFSIWYKSSALSKVVFRSTGRLGNFYYDELGNSLPASPTTWTQFVKTFQTPEDSTELTVFHLLEATGFLQTDEAYLDLASADTPVPTSFFSSVELSFSTLSSSYSLGPLLFSPSVASFLTYLTPFSSFTPPKPAGTSSSTTVPFTTTTKTTTTTVPAGNLVPNPSLEAASGSQPQGFVTSFWGTNKRSFEYLTTGRSGSRSVKVTLTSYKDGDAKWMMDPVPLPVSRDYKFSFWYKSNTVPKVVADYIKGGDIEEYYGLPDPEPGTSATSAWQYYEGSFSVPADTMLVSVFVFLDRIGWVQTDDYAIVPYTFAPFARPMISLVFDDGFEENLETVLPLLGRYGFKSTQCYATIYIEGMDQQINNVRAFADAGHEICAHSVTHPFFTTIPVAEQQYELEHSRDYLRHITGQPVDNFASPYGDYSVAVNNEIKKYYVSHRTTDEGYNSRDNLNPYRLRVQNMIPTTTLEQFQGWVQKTIADRTWLILLYHKVANDGVDAYDTYLVDFTAQMGWLSTQPIAVLTWRDALNEATRQPSRRKV